MRKIIKNLALFICCVISLSCNGQSKPATDFSILGGWKLIGKFAADNTPLSPDEKKRCLGDTITFMKNKIIASNDYCFMGYSCLNVNYSIKKVNVLDDPNSDDPDDKDGNKLFIKVLNKMGLKGNSIYLISTSCEVPYGFIWVLDDNHITFGMDGFLYWFQRMPNKK
jgi:hypothetical protein